LIGPTVDKNDQDSLNALSDNYIHQFPLSKYTPFVKRFIRYELKSSDFAFGYDLFTGFAPLQGNISKSFTGYGYIGFSIDFVYKQLNLDLSLVLAASKLRHDIIFPDFTWDNEMKTGIFIPQMQLGYTFSVNRPFNVTPFIGISQSQILPSYDEMINKPYLEDTYISSKISWQLGMSLNLYSKISIPFVSLRKSVQYQFFAKIKYCYSNLVFEQDTYDFNGAMHQITLSLGFLSRRVYRIY
jgi:hypothetical protein